MSAPRIARAYVVHGADAPGFWAVGNLWRAMATGVQTGNSLCLLDQVCTSDGGGPPTHTHTQDEGLYVVSGHCTFHAGGHDLPAGPGTFVSVPRHTPHAFAVDAPDTRLLNFYLPAGFELILMGVAVPAERDEPPPVSVPPPAPRRLVERLSADYGQAKVLGLPFADPPGPDNMATAPGPDALVPPFAMDAGRAPSYWHAGGRWSMLASGEQTTGAFCLFEQLLPRGPAAPPHLHEGADEAFYVLEGELTFLLRDRQERAREGAFAFIPRGTVHGFRVDSAQARLLNLYDPAGFERSVTTLGQPAPSPGPPPPGWTAPEVGPERRATLFAELGVRTLAVTDPLRSGV